MGCGGRWEGGSGWGTHVSPWLIHVKVWPKPLQYCKVISLQLIKINEKKKKKKVKKNKNKKTTKKPGSLGDRMWGEKILIQFHFMLFFSTFLLVHWGLGSSRPRTMTSTTGKGGEYHPWDYLLPSRMNTLFCFQVSLNIEWKISQSLCCFFCFCL